MSVLTVNYNGSMGDSYKVLYLGSKPDIPTYF